MRLISTQAIRKQCCKVTIQRPDSLTWTVADFEALLEFLPDCTDKDCDLACVQADLGPDLAVVLTCPRLFRAWTEHCFSFAVFFRQVMLLNGGWTM